MCETDKRGKHKNRPNRVSGSQVEFIKRHIKSFPVTESHFCRKDSKTISCPRSQPTKNVLLISRKKQQKMVSNLKKYPYTYIYLTTPTT